MPEVGCYSEYSSLQGVAVMTASWAQRPERVAQIHDVLGGERYCWEYIKRGEEMGFGGVAECDWMLIRRRK